MFFFDDNLGNAAPGFEGDINNDGTINAADIELMNQYFAGLRQFTPDELQRADVAPFATRGDGVFDATDAQLIRNYANQVADLQSTGGPSTLTPIVSTPTGWAPAAAALQPAAGGGDAGGFAIPETIFGIPTLYVGIGAAAAFFFFGRK